MDETKRTKILGGALAATLGFMFIRPDQMVFEPITKAKNELKSVEKQHGTESDKDFQRELALNRISNARDISMTSEPTVAVSQYQTWLTNLAEQCKFVLPEVNPRPPKAEKGKGYTSVSVDIETEAKMEDLSRFLYLFDQADLKHRISALEVTSTGAQGEPRMKVSLTAEALSVDGSGRKAEIFPTTTLPEEIKADSSELTVASAADFPEDKEFFALIDREMVKVTKVEENKLTLERGVEGTKAKTHEPGRTMELFPMAFDKQDQSFDQYESFAKLNPFLKPVPEKIYKPGLKVSDKTVAPGDMLELSVSVTEINKDIGEPAVNLLDAIDGMNFDPESNKLIWEVPEDAEPKTYTAKFILTQANNPDLKLEESASITVKLPNEKPTLELDSSAVVILGREFKLPFTGSDDGGDDQLTFAIEGSPPEGLELQGSEIVWEPPRTFLPDDYSVTIKATDAGDPAQSATATINLKVMDDLAAMTRFTGSLGKDGVQVAWFWNQIEDERPELKIGERIEVADIDAQITEIAARHVLMEDDEGTWKLKLGQKLRERELVKPAEPAAEEADAEAENTEEPAADMPATEEPATEGSDAEQPATDQPVTEEPAAAEPGAEAPNTEAPAAEPDSGTEPEAPAVEAPATPEPTKD